MRPSAYQQQVRAFVLTAGIQWKHTPKKILSTSSAKLSILARGCIQLILLAGRQLTGRLMFEVAISSAVYRYGARRIGGNAGTSAPTRLDET